MMMILFFIRWKGPREAELIYLGPVILYQAKLLIQATELGSMKQYKRYPGGIREDIVK